MKKEWYGENFLEMDTLNDIIDEIEVVDYFLCLYKRSTPNEQGWVPLPDLKTYSPSNNIIYFVSFINIFGHWVQNEINFFWIYNPRFLQIRGQEPDSNWPSHRVELRAHFNDDIDSAP